MSTEATRPGQRVYDPAREQQGVVQAVHRSDELLFDPKVPGARIAFLRAEGGGLEWTADADTLWTAPGTEGGPACETASP